MSEALLLHLARWAIGAVLLAAGLWVIALNGTVFWRQCVRRRPAPSWIPLVGGGLGMLALLILPLPHLRKWSWLAFVVDWGSLPGILYTVAWLAARTTRALLGRD